MCKVKWRCVLMNLLALNTKQLNDIYKFVGNLLLFDSLIIWHGHVKLDMRKFANVIY